MNRNKIISVGMILACLARRLGRFTELEDAMHAMVLKTIGTPLEWTELADPEPGRAKFA